ncbi:hypothetical protein F2P56_024520 [Juglans regia]|uniref:F-box domain-containing protein n=2 Tax=Juglans regia TaxID=51240 RepID=A0A833UCK0_JUGRE|nr:F-box protein At3g07870-like [Juglans regia]KAF5454887.1 hypothetical protein F2P56_024520 [Juglans regia]
MESKHSSSKANNAILEDDGNQKTTADAGGRGRCYFSELPWHIMLEILLRLHIEAVIRCRYVCKAWRELLLDPSFAKLHCASKPMGVVLQSSLFPHGNSGGLYLLEPQEQEPSSIIAKFNQFPYLESTIVNSCHGLICSCDILMADPIYISNPITGEYLILPKGETKPDFGQFVSGFGFSPKTKQYKVVKYSESLEIYTLGSGTPWRRTEHVPPARHRSLFGTFVNGALHWLVKLPNGSVLIRSFDLDDEKFRTIPLPLSRCSDASFKSSNLGILGDCLSLSSIVMDDASGWDIEIWVMKEYGVRESWIRELVIKSPSPCEQGWNPEQVQVINVLKNGEIVINCGGCPVIYNVGQESFRLLKPNGIFLTHVNAIAHASSFVSLKDIIVLGDGSEVGEF